MLYLVVVTMACAPLARAQLSTSLSSPLDTDLNGLDSNVAPIPSGEIEPGAGNLQTPEERQLPYDAIGASVVATMMDPTITQYYGITRTPYQLDSSVRDATQLTGQHQRIPLNITEMIHRPVGGMDASTRLKSAAAVAYSTNSFIVSGAGVGTAIGAPINTLAPGDSIGMANLPSSSYPFPPPTAQPSTPATTSTATTAGGIPKQQRNRAQALNSSSGNGPQQPVAQERDYSLSPLERVDTSSLQPVPEADSPFRDLGQTSFLNPDITLSAPRQSNSNYGQKNKSPYTTSSRIGNSTSKLNQLQRYDMTVSRAEERLLLRQQGLDMRRAKKPKWRNPILQQMEDESNQ